MTKALTSKILTKVSKYKKYIPYKCIQFFKLKMYFILFVYYLHEYMTHYSYVTNKFVYIRYTVYITKYLVMTAESSHFKSISTK